MESNLIAGDISPIIVASDLKASAQARFKALTKREREVALRLAHSQRQAQIARDLGISLKTVQTHRERALFALSLCSNQELAILAYVAGLVEAP